MKITTTILTHHKPQIVPWPFFGILHAMNHEYSKKHSRDCRLPPCLIWERWKTLTKRASVYPKCVRIPIVSCQTSPENVMKIRYAFTNIIVKRQTDKRTNQPEWKHYLRRLAKVIRFLCALYWSVLVVFYRTTVIIITFAGVMSFWYDHMYLPTMSCTAMYLSLRYYICVVNGICIPRGILHCTVW